MRRLSEEQVNLVAARAGALADATRVRILEVLSQSERPVGQIAALLDCEPSLVSKHLQVLHHAGLVRRRRAASSVIYSISATDLPSWCRYLAMARFAPASKA